MQRLRERTNGYTVTPGMRALRARGAWRADADRPDRPLRAPERVWPRVPDVAEVLRQRVSAPEDGTR